MEPNKNTSVFLKDVANIVMGQSPAGSSYNPNEGIEFHQGKSYFGEVLLDRSPIKTTQPTKFAQDGDIVICVRAPVGIVNITDRKICIGRGLASISAKDSIDQRFLFYLIQSKKKVIEILASGSTFSCISGPQLSELMLDIPSKDKQSVISKALYSLEKHISNLEQLICKQESIKKTTLKMLLTPQSNWIHTNIGSLVTVLRGESLQSKNFVSGNIPVVAGGVGIAGYHNKSNRPGNTITISASGANAGFINFYKEPIFATDCSTISETNSLDTLFLYYVLKSKQDSIFKMQTGGAQPHVHPKDISRINIFIPNLEEQQRIATQLSEIDAHIENLKQQLAKQRAIKQGLMDYFFGN